MTRERCFEICANERPNLVKYCRWPKDPRTGRNARTKQGKKIEFPLETAEDLAHDALLKFIKNHESINDGSGDNPTGYLYAIAYSVIMDRGRKPLPVPYGMLEGLDSERVGQRSAYVYTEYGSPQGKNKHATERNPDDWSDLHAALSQLPDNERQAIRLCYGFGTAGLRMTYKQIAEVMGKTEDSVGKLLSRGRERLRKMLNNRYAGYLYDRR